MAIEISVNSTKPEIWICVKGADSTKHKLGLVQEVHENDAPTFLASNSCSARMSSSFVYG